MILKKYSRPKYMQNHINDFISLFYPELKKEIKECEVLDIGCHTGFLDICLAPHVKSVKGIDISPKMIQKARNDAKDKNIKNAHFSVISAFDLDKKEKYDIIILSEIIEHVKEQKQLLKISLELLKDDGVMFVSTPNKLWPLEPHARLLFLGYLPPTMADKYSRFVRKRGYNGYYLMSYSNYVKLLKSSHINYIFKPWPNPQRMIHKIGKLLVNISPSFWRFSNAFQTIVIKRTLNN